MRSSLSVAKAVLRSKGFEVVAELVPVRVGGYEVSDVDLLAVRSGERYAVEVKSGRLDVGGIRQAFINAMLLNSKPLIICRGFSDAASEALAKELGVEIIVLDDLLLSDPEELRRILREEVRSALIEVLPSILYPSELDDQDLLVLKSIVHSSDFLEAASSLGMTPEQLGSLLKEMRSRGKVPKWAKDYAQVKEWAESILLRG
ncbi:MAG: recombinase RecB [Candidatus Korarchaeum sp.]|nr:recombinase RecB [Candidatus Korarchaeum sp.]